MHTHGNPYGLYTKTSLPAIAFSLLVATGNISETLANTLELNCERTCGEQVIPTPQGELGKYFNKPKELQSTPNEDNIIEGGSCKGIEIEWCPIEERVLKILEPEALS